MKRFIKHCIFSFVLILPQLLVAQDAATRERNKIIDLSKGKTPATFTPSTDAQTIKSRADQDRVADPKDLIRKYAATITASDLEAHLGFLASDELEGRETGTRGQKLASLYLAAQFQKMGLEPGNQGSWFQEYKLNNIDVISATISLTGKNRLEAAKDFVCFEKASLIEDFEAPYAFAGFGIKTERYDNLKGLDLQGKVAVVLAGEPIKDGKSLVSGNETKSEWSQEPSLKLNALRKEGAKAALIAMSDEKFEALIGNRWIKYSMIGKSLTLAYKDEMDSPIPAFYISETSLNTLLKKCKTNVSEQQKMLDEGPEVTKIDFGKSMFSVQSDATNEVAIASNVLGFIEGTDKKDEVVVITAHYDHLGVHDGNVFNGADDDGSGTVGVLEIAEAFMAAVKEGHRPRRSILLMPVSGEEKGLLGSEYYSDHPVYALNKTVCDLNIDMIGRVDEKHKGEPQYIYIIGSDKLSSQLHEANESANKVVSNLELDYEYNSPDDPNRFYYRSDHYNFAKNNIPVIFYFSGVHEDYHKPTDDVEKILYPKCARVAQLVFSTAWDVANREEKLVVDKKNDFGER